VVAPHLLHLFEIKQPVFAAEFNWDRVLAALKDRKLLFTPLPKFQVVTRDFSLMLEKNVTFNDLRKVAFKTQKKILKEVTLFDVYEGEKIEKGKKSYALSFTLLDEEKTLTDKQIDQVMMSLAKAFEKEFNAVIRGMN
jgi:phenylalanyl-tRNA synthetase beta chain